MFKQTTVTYVPEHLLPISPVCTKGVRGILRIINLTLQCLIYPTKRT